MYHDDPVYVGNEQPIEKVKTWARGRPGYQDIWLDRDHFGWIAVAFTGDAAAHQEELRPVPRRRRGCGRGAGDGRRSEALQEQAQQLLVDAGVEFAGSAPTSTAGSSG